MRPVWNGAISFGLVNIPCDLVTAEVTNDLKFHLVDSRNEGRIRYERVNEETGEEVPWNKIVKAYEFSDDNYVIVTDEDFEKADVKATKTIDIEAFVEREEVDMVYFEKPYYVRPRKGGEKAYSLFRDALEKSGKIAISRVVIRTREYLAAIFQEKGFLILDLLRFANELRSAEDISIPEVQTKEKELDLALKLIEDMTVAWKPEEYKDEYRLALMERIKKKAEGMNLEVPEEEEEEDTGKVVDIMDLLKQSVEKRTNTKKETKPSSSQKTKTSTASSKSSSKEKTTKSKSTKAKTSESKNNESKSTSKVDKRKRA